MFSLQPGLRGRVSPRRCQALQTLLVLPGHAVKHGVQGGRFPAFLILPHTSRDSWCQRTRRLCPELPFLPDASRTPGTSGHAGCAQSSRSCPMCLPPEPRALSTREPGARSPDMRPVPATLPSVHSEHAVLADWKRHIPHSFPS